MTLYQKIMQMVSSLQRTTSVIYGEMMRDSRISLPHGRYINPDVLVSQLMDSGLRTIRQQLIKDLTHTTFYGITDNIWSRVQAVQELGGQRSQRDLYELGPRIFNPWRELMGSSAIYYLAHSTFFTDNMGYDSLKFKVLLQNP